MQSLESSALKGPAPLERVRPTEAQRRWVEKRAEEAFRMSQSGEPDAAIAASEYAVGECREAYRTENGEEAPPGVELEVGYAIALLEAKSYAGESK